MVFSSTIFLFLFLPVFLTIYLISPSKLKNFILLLFSLIFYSWGENILVLLLLLSSLVDYGCGIMIENGKRNTGLTLSILFNVSILASFKYLDFAFSNYNFIINALDLNKSFLVDLPHIALPIGISFFTFQTMSYTIDVYRKQIRASRNFLQFASYVSMFPQLVAGPIVRYSSIAEQLKQRKTTTKKISAGIERFIIGLAKKVLIANTFAAIADSIFDESVHSLSTHFAWIGVIAYTFQIYYDFSGYSDMAIGLGKIMGFDFPENFNYPYISKSIREFWRRWHISLSTWFRDYVYISLGGNRKGPIRTYFNLIIVFFLTGLWHGASWNFVIWGMFHGFFLVVERIGFNKILNRIPTFFSHVYVLFVVLISWVFFRADNLSHSLLFLKRLFIPTNGSIVLNNYLDFFHINAQTIIALIVAIIFSMPVYPKFKSFIASGKLVWLNYSFLIILLLLSVIYLTADTYNPFIYYRF